MRSDGTVIPQDLGLDWAVSKKKDDFIGKRAQQRSHMTDPDRWKLVGLSTLDGSVLPDGAYAVAEGKNANGQDALLVSLNAMDGVHGHLHGSFYRPAKPFNSAQEALFHAVRDTGRAIGLELDWTPTGGVCEGNNIFAAGVPNVDTLGVRGGAIHSTEEFLLTDSFEERAGLSLLLLNRIADGRIDAAAIKAMMD